MLDLSKVEYDGFKRNEVSGRIYTDRWGRTLNGMSFNQSFSRSLTGEQKLESKVPVIVFNLI